MTEFEISPLRSLNDFLLQGARFQMPNLNQYDAIENRIINNLYYYQTNYGLCVLCIFFLIGVFRPSEMFIGALCVASAFALFAYAVHYQPEIQRLRRKHQNICAALVMGVAYIFTYIFGSLVIFVFAVALPILLMLVHASLRMRNLKNKVANKIESIGITKSPMGLLLSTLGKEDN